MTRKQTPVVPGALSAHFPTAKAIAALLHPHAEVVVHDLATDRIVGIWNAFSKRKAGDPSFLGHDPGLLLEAETYGPYEKANADGTRLKSISAVLTDGVGRRLGFLCVNLDVSKFDTAIALLSAFAAPVTERPEPLFRHDWREQINFSIRDFLTACGKSLPALERSDKIALIGLLNGQGLFQTRNAIPFVAQALDVSRATIYGLLKATRGVEKKARRK